jgi:two-component system sensor histidine kinase/response regulator
MEGEINKLILIIDDNPVNIQVLAAVLTDAGYQTGVAMSGKQAFEFLEENIPALILLDIMMPEMDGFEVCERIKMNDNHKNIPVIFLTAKSENADILKGFKVGGVDYIVKPFNNAELRARVGTHMELKQSRDALVKLNEQICQMNEELEQRVAERTVKLKMLNDEQAAFSYAIAHDLRSPLRAMNGYSRFMLEDYSDKMDDDGKDLLQKINSNTLRIADLIDHLLSYSRLSRTEITRTLLNLNELVQSVVQDLQQNQQQRKIQFIVRDLPGINADATMITQLFIQLVSNAVKFTSKVEEAVIEIGINLVGNETVFFVRDNGAGFDMEFYNKLFGVFQRLHGVNEFEGYGIGLTFAKAIVDKHGGRIWAESEENKGATFYFTLPA